MPGRSVLRWLARPLLPGRSVVLLPGRSVEDLGRSAEICLSICIDVITGGRGNSVNFAQVLTRPSGVVHTQHILAQSTFQHIEHVVAQRTHDKRARAIRGQQCFPCQHSIAKNISSRTAWMYVFIQGSTTAFGRRQRSSDGQG